MNDVQNRSKKLLTACYFQVSFFRLFYAFPFDLKSISFALITPLLKAYKSPKPYERAASISLSIPQLR